ncbi:GNAT family N-acetyltransferase [Kiritimatiellota bacterium B12222]|nr:GNAT family N-acetyltransferase [Kiritimatiellota bacterium B12222]
MITYRQASLSELKLAVDWATTEGWNPGRHDAEIFYASDPYGFVCAEQAGEIIATGSIVAYEKAFGFMGFFIVRPDLRGQGIGRDFWTWRRNLLQSRLQPHAPIGMDGVFDMQSFYARGGFTFSHRNLRMEGRGIAGSAFKNLEPLSELPFEMISAYDHKHFGFARHTFLKAWIQPQEGWGYGAVSGESLTGMGVIRPCVNGYKIGPLFADDAQTADDLYQALSTHAKGQTLFLDIPEQNPAAQALAKRYQLKEVFGCARMYNGPAPQLPWSQIYGISSFELG